MVRTQSIVLHHLLEEERTFEDPKSVVAVAVAAAAAAAPALFHQESEQSTARMGAGVSVADAAVDIPSD